IQSPGGAENHCIRRCAGPSLAARLYSGQRTSRKDWSLIRRHLAHCGGALDRRIHGYGPYKVSHRRRDSESSPEFEWAETDPDCAQSPRPSYAGIPAISGQIEGPWPAKAATGEPEMGLTSDLSRDAGLAVSICAIARASGRLPSDYLLPIPR